MRAPAPKKPKVILIDYDKIVSDEKSLNSAAKPLASAFKKSGLQVSSFSSDGKIKRLDDYSFKVLKATFPDSQTVEFHVSRTGDIFKVKVNGRDFAIKSQDDHNKAVNEVVMALNSGRDAFVKKLSRVKTEPLTKKVSMSFKQRMEAAQKALTDAQSLLPEITAENDQLAQKVAVNDETIKSLNDEIAKLENSGLAA